MNIKRLLSASKKAVLAVASVAIVVSGLSYGIGTALASKPVTFNDMANPADPAHGDRELFTGHRVGAGGSWADPVTAAAGDEVEMLIYYHNTGDFPATNTMIKASLPSGFGTTLVSVASIDSDQTNKIYDTTVGVGGPIYGRTGMTINSTDQVNLEPVTGSEVWYVQDANGNLVANPFPNGQNLNTLLTGNGVNIGTINGCWQYAGYIKFRVRLTGGTAGATVEKKVQLAGDGDDWHTSINTEPGNYANYYVFYNNTGTATAKNVRVTDTLPEHLTWVSGANKAFWRVKDANNNDIDVPVDESTMTWSGRNFTVPFFRTDVAPVSSAAFFLVFQVMIDDASHFTVGDHVLINTGRVLADNGVDATTGQAIINVHRDAEPTINFFVNKTVANITIGQDVWNKSTAASPGDEVAFRVQVQNQGNTSATNVLVNDVLPNYLNYKAGSTKLFYLDPATGNTLELPMPDGFTNGGLRVDVPAGNENERIFTFRAFVSTSIPSGTTTLVNTGIVPAGANGSIHWIQASDTASVIISATHGMVVQKKDKTTGDWVENVTANEGDVVYFQIKIFNNGNTDLTGIHVHDTLPSYLVYNPGSTQIDGVPERDGITVGGKNITNLPPGEVKTITFSATVVDCPPLGAHDLQNVAEATATGVSQLTDDAWVHVDVTVPPTPEL